MKFGFAFSLEIIIWSEKFFKEILLAGGYKPDFIIIFNPPPKKYKDSYNIIKTLAKNFIDYLSLRKYLLVKLLSFRLMYRNNYFLKDANVKLYYSSKDFNSNKILKILDIEKPDILIVKGAGIVREIILDKYPNTIINVHPGKLPDYRGMSTIEWAIFNKDSVIGTAYYMSKGIDTGNIIFEKKLKNKSWKSVFELRETTFEQSNLIFIDALSQLSKNPGNIIPKKGIGKQWFPMHLKLKKHIENAHK